MGTRGYEPELMQTHTGDRSRGKVTTGENPLDHQKGGPANESDRNDGRHKHDGRRDFLTQCLTDPWNSLSQDVAMTRRFVEF